MADRAISALPTASTLTASDLFVLSQNNQAKNTTWQVIIGYLTAALDGHGGIQSIAKTGTAGLVDTYTITYADSSTTTFTVTNGKQISSITQYWAVSSSNTTVPSSWSTTRQEMTVENKYLWSYFRYTYNDGTTSDTTKSVVGVYGDTGQNWYVWIRYAGSRPTSDADIGTTPDNWIGIYSGTSATAPTSYTAYNWFEIKGEKGDTGDASAITQQSVTYLESASGTVVPEGSWTTTVPSVTPGNFLWTRTILTFNDETTITAYSVSRFGIDGTGLVSRVNNISPDTQGNVALTAANVPTSDNTSVQEHMNNVEDIVGNGTLSGFTATDLTGAANELMTDVIATDANLGTFVRPNLLDNWYFVGGGSQQGGAQLPINQRGQTVYTGNVYTVDRWKNNGLTSVTVNQDSIRLASTASWHRLEQSIEAPTKLNGKIVTISCVYKNSGDNTSKIALYNLTAATDRSLSLPKSSTFTLASATIEVPSNFFAAGDTGKILVYPSSGTPLDVQAIKLELGDTQTLAHKVNNTWVLNELPNYEEQLVRCKTSTADSADTYANKKIAYTNDMLSIRGKQVTIPANSDHLAITPDTVSGYTFFCWLAPASSGWIGFLYIEDPSLANTNVWALNVASSARNVNLAMVYIKN